MELTRDLARTIPAQEALRLEERFQTRARAVFYARLAFWVLGAGIIVFPSWRRFCGIEHNTAWLVIAGCLAYTLFAQWAAAKKPQLGRWTMFTTLIFDLVLLLWMVYQTGGLTSPFMGATPLFTIFFALLFPNPVGIVPPLMMLPAVVISRVQNQRPNFESELLFLLFYAVLNGVAVYVIVYLTGREEKQQREILELEFELKKLAVVEERNRLARDIHDGIGAALSGLIIQSEYLLTLAGKDQTLRSEILELKSAAEEAIDEVRRALSMMRNEFELVPQLENTCTTFTTRHRVPVELSISGEPPELSEEQQLAIFRIMQECLTNIAKHAGAKNVEVNVDFFSDRMKMLIIDDGAGFNPTKTPKHHYGLINIRERAKKAEGVVDIASAPGAGTRVTLEIHRPMGRRAIAA